MTEQEYYPRALALVQQFVPQYRLVPKSSSTYMKFLGWLFSLIGSSNYMTDYWTTIGYTTYVPSNVPPNSWSTIVHEGRHALQFKRWNILMLLAYTFPLSLCPVLAAVAVATALAGVGWPAVLTLSILSAVCLLPIPSYFRMLFEADAYIVELTCVSWVEGRQSVQDDIGFFSPLLTGASYYFAWPWKSAVQSRIQAGVDAGDIYGPLSGSPSPSNLTDPYLIAFYDDLNSQGLILPKGA